MLEVMHLCRMGLTWRWLLSSRCHHTVIVRSVHLFQPAIEMLALTCLLNNTHFHKITANLALLDAWALLSKTYNPYKDMYPGGKGGWDGAEGILTQASLLCFSCIATRRAKPLIVIMPSVHVAVGAAEATQVASRLSELRSSLAQSHYQ